MPLPSLTQKSDLIKLYFKKKKHIECFSKPIIIYKLARTIKQQNDLIKLHQTLLYLIILLSFTSCFNGPKSDSELLEKDKIELAEQLNSSKVSVYKFGKIMIRASAAKKDASPEIKSFQGDIAKVADKLVKKDNLNALDYLFIYTNYRKMKSFVDITNEDDYPTLAEALNNSYSDSLNKKAVFKKGNDKIYAQNIEHAILSTIVLLSQDLGKEIALYECSKTNPKLLPDSEIKTLLQFIRGFLFFEKKLVYLSEDEFTQNIDWLNKNPKIDLPYTRLFFEWRNLNNEQTHIAFHSVNHLFRAFDRLMMEREVDEERALQDFEFFLEDTKKIGLENEVVWSVETYLYLKKGNQDKAIVSLQKLQSSKIISNSDKKQITESIGYLKDRDSEDKLNNVYDKYFLSKIATKYIISILRNTDWKKILKDQNVQHTDEMFETVEKLKNLSNNLEKYASPEAIKNKTKDLFNKAKELTE